jgi:hypothetical protein
LLVFGILVLVSSYVTEHRLSFTEVLVPLFCCVVFVLVLLYAPYFVGQVVLFGLLLVLAPYARRTPRGVFFAMMLLWGASYFLFHSLYFQKVVRYYLPMLPGLAFIAAVAVDAAARKVGAVISHPRAGAALVVLASMGMLFYGAYGAVGDTHLDAEAQVNAANEEVAGYLATRLAGSPLIYSDYWVITGWMLGYPVYAMPVFSDEPAFAHELHKYRVDFYASYRDWYFEGYERVFSATEYYVFERRDAVEKPGGRTTSSGLPAMRTISWTARYTSRREATTSMTIPSKSSSPMTLWPRLASSGTTERRPISSSSSMSTTGARLSLIRRGIPSHPAIPSAAPSF